MDDERTFPTMIIPSGTEITVNEQGQLSVRTPGNLVIQNSGVYGVIESGNGSVRVDPQVRVEAVSVQASDTCFIAGELTAWRVVAKRIILEKGAQAHIMLQEAENLELDRSARLVGNFASQKELYLLLGRFSRQLRNLPQSLGPGERREERPSWLPRVLAEEESFDLPEDVREMAEARRKQEEGEVFALVRVVLERELGRAGIGEDGRTALEQLLEIVHRGDAERLEEAYRYLLSRVDGAASDDLRQARERLDRHFGRA